MERKQKKRIEEKRKEEKEKKEGKGNKLLRKKRFSDLLFI